MRLSQRQIFSRTCLNEFRIMHSSKIKMKQISRKYAISLKFSNNTILVMKYNFKEQIKTYFISEEKSIYRL
jgi:hypothetical protein